MINAERWQTAGRAAVEVETFARSSRWIPQRTSATNIVGLGRPTVRPSQKAIQGLRWSTPPHPCWPLRLPRRRRFPDRTTYVMSGRVPPPPGRPVLAGKSGGARQVKTAGAAAGWRRAARRQAGFGEQYAGRRQGQLDQEAMPGSWKWLVGMEVGCGARAQANRPSWWRATLPDYRG